MTHLRTTFLLKWVSSCFSENQLRQSNPRLWPNGYSLVSQNTRLYRTKRALNIRKSEPCSDPDRLKNDTAVKVPRRVKKAAQAAMLDYFHYTRNLPFLVAENMSRSSPIFLGKLLKTVVGCGGGGGGDDDREIERSISRFLGYNPVNEFEPFFESLGLCPDQYIPLLPRDLLFVSEAGPMLTAHHELCNYGFPRQAIGKIYVEAPGVVCSSAESLRSMLGAYEKLLLGRLAVVKIVSCSPRLLIGNGSPDGDFVAVLERLKSLGFGPEWIEGNLVEGNTYNWSHVLEIFGLFSKLGLSEEQIVGVLGDRPDILFEDSGNRTFSLVGFLLKFGYETDKLSSLFLQFPTVQVGNFVSNLRRSLSVLTEIEMEGPEIGGLIRSRAPSLGGCTLMRANSLISKLRAGKKKIRAHILENPKELENLVLGARLEPLPGPSDDLSSKALKTKFLLSLGYEEDSDEMKKAQRLFRGKGNELQERFDLIMSYGLDRDEVRSMVKVSPQILNLKKVAIKRKIDLFVEDLGYPVSCLQIFPSHLNYTVERIKLRLSMYEWLKARELVDPTLALSTIVASSEKDFVRQYVNRNPDASEVWKELKHSICSKQTII